MISTPLPKFPFVVLDTETTGLTERVDKIIELAIVRFEEGEKVAEYESLFDVGRDIPPHVQVLTRIKPEDVHEKPKFDPSIVSPLLEGAVLVGHNIPFDIGMLKGEGVDLEGKPWIDTAMLASLVFPECASWSLPYLSETLDLPHEPKHRAMGDVHAAIALLGRVWERLSELPEESLREVKNFAEKSTEGYAALFSSLNAGKGDQPKWLSCGNEREKNKQRQGRLGKISDILDAAPLKKERTWIAVKNLHATMRSLGAETLEKLSVAHAPPFLLNPDTKKEFLKQDIFTVYELTLAIKLLFYEPLVQNDFPIHSEERDVWKGKLACTKEAKAYAAQFDVSGKNILIDHRQLLELLERGGGPTKGDKVVIDDASMLEDTATKAFRWSCSADPLRAAAEGNAELTSFLDAYQIWIEKVRNFQDTRYFVEADLASSGAKGLRERLETLLSSDLTEQVRERLEDLKRILDPKSLEGRIAYISQFRDGGQIVQSVPMDVAGFIKTILYDKFETTLILPPGDNFVEVIPIGAEVKIVTDEVEDIPLLFADEHLTLDRLLGMVDGKAIALISSKRTIEQLFIKHEEALEAKGITLISQGLSGGTGRMQAEFCACEGPVVWLITPWAYEGIELPPETVDHLWVHTFPFDHPAHAVLSRRAEKYDRNEFDKYFVPRMLYRIFRILRTYCSHKKKDANLIVLDERIRTKNYGGRVRAYLEQLLHDH